MRMYLLIHVLAAVLTAGVGTAGASPDAATQAPAPAERAPQASTPAYGTPTILRPQRAETVHDNSGTVQVEVALSAPLRLQAGHRLRVRLDGRLLPGTWQATRFSLAGVERGTHTLQVIVTDAAGNRLAASEPIEFHLWQASRLFRANPRG